MMIDMRLLILLTPIALWMALPTSLFIRAESLTVNDERVATFVRQTPFGDVSAEFLQEITLLDGTDFECRMDGYMPAFYQSRKSNVVRYRLGSWADDCLEHDVDYTITTSRRVVVAGWLPLRPHTTVDLVEVNK